MGKTHVAYREISFTLPPEYRAAVREVRFEAGHSDAKDDAAFWQKVQGLAVLVFGTAQAGAVIYGEGVVDLPPLIFN